MKSLIVEDEFSSRMLLQRILLQLGWECHIAVTGKEAISAYELAISENLPYDLICMDIMMPEMDGQSALKEIRAVESQRGIAAGDGVKIIMTSALKNIRTVAAAYKEFCDSFLVKPIDPVRFLDELEKLKLIKRP